MKQFGGTSELVHFPFDQRIVFIGLLQYYLLLATEHIS